HPVLEAFISLLSLPDSRFVSDAVLALLDVPVLAARFDITQDGLASLGCVFIASRSRSGSGWQAGCRALVPTARHASSRCCGTVQWHGPHAVGGGGGGGGG
ncbi:exodeoxyribonuclease V subunit gamma, partial [Escherichia coli]|uniref:exodeoxyribonuclease V subunit gamma n=1 Tax=Escherichia coli TaxID=562 RepID=UPI0010CC3D77